MVTFEITGKLPGTLSEFKLCGIECSTRLHRHRGHGIEKADPSCAPALFLVRQRLTLLSVKNEQEYCQRQTVEQINQWSSWSRAGISSSGKLVYTARQTS